MRRLRLHRAGLTAAKAGIAEASRVRSVQRLVGDDARFAELWATTSRIPGQFGELNAAAMFSVLHQLRPRRIVEIGSYLGRSTTFLGLALRMFGGEELVAIDPHTGDRQILEALGVTVLPSFALFETHVASVGLQDLVRPIVKPSADVARTWNGSIDFLYVDGWHSFDAVLEDGRAWLPHLAPGGVAFFDDFARYPEVYDAVRALNGTGALCYWGNAFGQAFGGLSEPVPAAQNLMRECWRPMKRWQHRPRSH